MTPWERRASRRNWYRRFKENYAKCVYCGETNPDLIDWHHPEPSLKRANVSDLVQRGCSVKRILAEISVCFPVCCVCHRTIHATERQQRRTTA